MPHNPWSIPPLFDCKEHFGVFEVSLDDPGILVDIKADASGFHGFHHPIHMRFGEKERLKFEVFHGEDILV